MSRLIMRCTSCPPQGFCADCAGVNRARQEVGLLVTDLTPGLANTVCQPMAEQMLCLAPKYRGYTGFKDKISRKRQPVVSQRVISTRNGWHRGIASLNGQPLITGKPCRDYTTAASFARNAAELIRDGLDYERKSAVFKEIDL